MKKFIPALLTVMLAWGSTVAHADSPSIPNSQFQVGHWVGQAYAVSQSDPTFSYCAITANYNSGSTVYYALGRRAAWFRFALSNPNWRFIPGQVYPIGYTIDNLPPQAARAVAISSYGVAVELPPTTTIFNALRYGHLLTVITVDQVLQFQLDGTAAALTALLQCATTDWSDRTNPFGQPIPPNPVPPPDSNSGI